MTSKKYLIIPGFVVSKKDGDRHYIPDLVLMNLYGVNPAECIIAKTAVYECIGKTPEEMHPDLIPLRPRYDGKYRETFEEIKNRKYPLQ